MSGDRLEVNVTFDERGYIGSAPELRSSAMALSLGGLRRKIEIAMLPDDVRVVLQLDDLAERERHRRRAQAQLSRIAQLDQRTALPDQCLHSAEADVRPPRRKSGFDPTTDIGQLAATMPPYQFQGVGGRGRGPLPTDFVSFCCGPRANERASFASG